MSQSSSEQSSAPPEQVQTLQPSRKVVPSTQAPLAQGTSGQTHRPWPLQVQVLQPSPVSLVLPSSQTLTVEHATWVHDQVPSSQVQVLQSSPASFVAPS